MDRRSFFVRSEAEQAVAELAPPDPVSSGIRPYSGKLTAAEATHLLERTMFGAKPTDIKTLTGLTAAQAIDKLLQFGTETLTVPVKTYTLNAANTPATDPDWGVAAGQPWVDVHTNDGSVNGLRRANFKYWWMGQMIDQDSGLREKMVLFWHNHFATETTDVRLGVACYRHNQVLRKFAMGNFRELLKAVTLDAAMLRYLNGEDNNKNAPDENYSRELQELFTVGKGPDSKYTEQDVREAARVLTGYRVRYPDLTVYFDAGRHDTGTKSFSAFYGGKTIAGRSGASGAQELDDLLDMLLANSETARHLSRKLYRFFINSDISTAIERNVILPLAQLMQQQQYQMKPVMAALFQSEHFYDPLIVGCQIKSPLDLVIGSIRTFDVSFPPVAEVATRYQFWQILQSQAANQQLNIGDPPDVSGWKAYYQDPQFYEIWVNSDTLPKRNQFTDTMVNNGYTRSGRTIRFDVIALAKKMSNPGNPNLLIDDLVQLLYRVPLSTTVKEQMKKDILLTGQAQDYYWTGAWNAHTSNPGDMAAETTVRTRLRNLLQYLMNLAEFQLT